METEHVTRMSTALGRCGDVNSAYERTTFFIEGLTPRSSRWCYRPARIDRDPRLRIPSPMRVRSATPTGPRTPLGDAWTSGSPALLNRLSPPYMALRRFRPAPLLVFERHGEPRTTSLQKATTSGGLLPFRQRNPPSTTETHCSTATGVSRILPPESPSRAFADFNPGKRPIITRRICGDLPPRRSSASPVIESGTIFLPTAT